MKQRMGIRVKLTLFFLVPVIFIVVLGVSSYSKASSALQKNYEESAISTVKSVGNYFELVFSVARNKVEQVLSRSEMTLYYGGAYESGSDDEVNARSQIASMVKQLAKTDDIVGDLSVLSYRGRAMSSNGNYLIIEPGVTAAGEYDKTEEHMFLQQWSGGSGWTGTHSYIDSMGISPEDYCITYTEPFYNALSEKLGYVSVDIRTAVAVDSLGQIDLGEGSVFALIAPDGTETTKDGVVRDGTSLFFDTDFYRNALASGESAGVERCDDNGQTYLYLFSKISDSGAMICGRIPNSVIVASAQSIRSTTMVVMVVAIALSVLLGLLVSTGYGVILKKTVDVLARAADGDLNQQIRSKRKDEFGALADATDRMTQNIKKLIHKVNLTTEALGSSAQELAVSSDGLVLASTQITGSVEEIRKGIVQQADDSTECLNEAATLTEKISVVRENVSTIENQAEVAKRSVDTGREAVHHLEEKARQTAEVTRNVIQDIEELSKETQTIGTIIGTINDIAEQTNLLSLNASIEAARAGEAGRGFAVVAEEIRKLAEQSAKAAGEIGTIIRSIVDKTERTVQIAKNAEAIVEQQSEAVSDTMTEFGEIGGNVAQIAERLKAIGTLIEAMEQAKTNTLSAVESISAVSEQTAAESGEVEKTAAASQKAAEELNSVIRSLNAEAETLRKELSAFHMEEDATKGV